MNDPTNARSDTTAARRVLRDCHIAVRMCKSAPLGAERRIAWTTAVTLLRTVGHVLDKVDGSRSNYLRAAIDECWGEVRNGGPNHEIFNDFIECERNNILKEYKPGESSVWPIATGSTDSDKLLIGSRILSAEKALQEALHWWEVLLGQIEESANRRLIEQRALLPKRSRRLGSRSPTTP
jgi:hypothetical protein